MNIQQHDLARHLKQAAKLPCIYLITGDEILLVEESVALILAKARADGFEERIVIETETSESMDNFMNHRQNYSLFSMKKILEVRFRQKVSAAWAALLVEISGKPDSNQIILLRLPKLSRAETQLKWYKTLEQHAWIITIWPLKQEHFSRWIQSRCKLLHMKLNSESLALITANTEGNLLAASQVVEKLNLIHGASGLEIPYTAVQQTLSDQTHYDVFALCDATLAQKPQQCLKILATLKKQGSEPAIILWALMNDIRKLDILSRTSPASRNAVYQKQGIWSTRQVLFQKALNSFNPALLKIVIEKAKLIDEMIKGVNTGNVWSVLEDLCLLLVTR